MQLLKTEQRSEEWFAERPGKVTGTMLSRVVGGAKARENAMYEIIASRLSPDLQHTDENARDRGIRLEPEAREAFMKKTKKKVEVYGLAVSDSNPDMAFSPDGLIKNKKGKYTEAIEIKCPLGSNYVRAWHRNEVPRDYIAQLAQAFIVNKDLRTMHFVLYNPDVKCHPMHVIKVTRKSMSDVIKAYEKDERDFLEEVTKIENELL